MNPCTEKFMLALGDGTSCTAQIDYTNIESAPQADLPKLVKMDCQGLWNETHFDRYIPWIAELWQRIADAANRPLCGRLFSPLGESVTVICEPGLRPAFYSPLQLSLL